MRELTVVVRDQPAFIAAIESQIATFEQTHPDVKVTRVSPGIEECYDRFVKNGGCAKGETDLFLTVTDWIPEGFETGQFKDLTHLIDSLGNPLPWHSALRNVVRFQERYLAIPYHCGPQVLHIRRDLFEDPNQRKAFFEATKRELTVPASWNEFLEVATFFTQPENNLYGCCVGAFPDGHNDVYDFLTLLWAHGGDVTEVGADFESQAAQKALDFYGGLFESRIVHPDCLNMNSFESGEHYVKGNVAMMWNWFGFASFADDPDLSSIVGKNEVHPVPKGASPCALNVFWAMTIASGSKEPALAREFLSHLMTPESDLLTCEHGCIGARLSSWKSPNVLHKFPQYEVLDLAYANARPLPSISNWNQIQNSITQRVSQRLRGHDANP